MKDDEVSEFVQDSTMDSFGAAIAETSPEGVFFEGVDTTEFEGHSVHVSKASPDHLLLIEYTCRGNQRAFELLVQRYRTLVVATATRRGLPRGLAEDVAQEVFAILSAKAPHLATRSSLAGWLHRATIYEATRTLQSEARRNSRNRDWSTDLAVHRSRHSPAVDRTLELLDEALDELGAADREILILHYFQELSYPEIAAKLRITEPAIRQRVSRAISRLDSRLQAKGVRTGAAAALLAAAAVQHGTATAGAVAFAAAATGGAAAQGVWSAISGLFTSGVAKGVLAGTIAAAVVVVAAKHQAPSDPASERVRAAVAIQQPLNADLASSGAAKIAAQRSNQAALSARTVAASAAMVRASVPRPAISDQPQRLNAKPTAATPASPRPLAEAGKSQKPGSNGSDAAAADLAGSTPGTPGNMTEAEGVSQVLDLLQSVEQDPEEAAELYSGLLGEALNLAPVERDIVSDLLLSHFEALKDADVAGAPVSEAVVSTWKAVREPLTTMLVDDITTALSEVAPDLPTETLGQTVEQVLTIPEKLVTDVVQPVEESRNQTVTETADPLVEDVVDTVQDLLPVKLPLLR